MRIAARAKGVYVYTLVYMVYMLVCILWHFILTTIQRVGQVSMRPPPPPHPPNPPSPPSF